MNRLNLVISEMKQELFIKGDQIVELSAVIFIVDIICLHAGKENMMKWAKSLDRSWHAASLESP